MPAQIPSDILKLFDAKWYSEFYPDVAAAKVDPLHHFQNYGWKEGRWPCAFESVALDNQLWMKDNADEIAARLKEISEDNKNSEQGLATWFLCRWLASYGEWQTAKDYIEDLLNHEILLKLIPHDGLFTLAFTVYYHCEEIESALSVLNNSRWAATSNKSLAASMLEKGEKKIACINEIFKHSEIIQLTEKSSEGLDNLISLTAEQIKVGYTSPLVSIIIPCYNAEKTISVAISSLLEQTYPKIEVIVVDDASSDGSKDVVEGFCEKDSRVKYLQLKDNKGAYVARNSGLKLSKGQFVTTHDADDWSHPQKIEKQLQALKENRKAKASVSHWVRTTANLNFERWRIEDGWIYRNVSSLLFHRSVFRKLGYWDSVSVNADTEYYFRILSKFGSNAIMEVLPGVPIAFGRVADGSLTQMSATHIRTQFSGIRKEYNDAANEWHSSARSLYMPETGLRKFIAPPLICRGSIESRKENLKNVIKAKCIFDASWYLAAYPDIAAAGVDPLKHFINHGLEEGRDPNPTLSISGLAYINKTSHFEALSAWASEPMLKSRLLSVKGSAKHASAKKILMIAHLAGKELFGAERSFLDCIRMLCTEGAAISVILPSGVNHEYIYDISHYCERIYFTPIPWWRFERTEIAEVTAQISAIIKECNASIVYVNTLTLWEPHIAAKRSNAKSVMHVRELPNHDQDLCMRMNATPKQIREHVDENSDLIIANSNVTSGYIDLNNKTTVIYNSIDSEQFSNKRPLKTSSTLNVVMLSSNTVKKGIDDLFKLAEATIRLTSNIHFYIYGPSTSDLTKRLELHNLPNITYRGYTTDPINAYKEMDVVLNLSHFQESFGRTIVEGMASGCVPVGYAWGALEEVIDSRAGYLVPLKQYNRIIPILNSLLFDTDKIRKKKENAAKIVKEKFGKEIIAKELSASLIN